MLATTFTGRLPVSKAIVEKVNLIVDEAIVCGRLCDPVVVGDDSLNTFMRTLRCVSVEVEDEIIVKFKLTLPTPASGLWISSLDPFLFAESLRSIGVSLDITVYDHENPDFRSSLFIYNPKKD